MLGICSLSILESCMIGVNRGFGICEGECMGCSSGDELMTLMICHSCGLPQLYEALEGWKSVCG